MSGSPTPDRESNFAYWSRWATFALGMVIILFELLVVTHRDYGDYFLMAIGTACLGPTIAQSVGALLETLPGGRRE